MSNNFKAGCSPLTDRILVGTVKKDDTWGSDKKDITDTAPSAVAQFLLQTDQSIEFTHRNGKKYALKVVEL